MEVCVQAAAGCSMPTGTYVAVKVGDVLKQGRYEANRAYHFPQAERRRTAKVDVFKHVGSCVVPVDPEVSLSSDFKVSSVDKSVGDLRLRVNVQPNKATVQ